MIQADRLSAANGWTTSSHFAQLCPLEATDRSWLFDLYVGRETGFRWIFEGAVPTWQELNGEYDPVFDYPLRWVVRSGNGEQRVGAVLVGPMDIENETAQIGVCIAPAFMGRGYGAMALFLCCHVLFSRLHFRKVRSHALEFSENVGYKRLSTLAVREACLREHHYFQGRYWDVNVYAILRTEWDATIRPSLGRLIPTDDA